ncbi:MAG TPA: VOC family protein [Amycolatopsis sp.]|nr:VOC family protein [Amycolatopsis sp.]
MGQPYDTEVPTEFGLGLHHVQLAVPPGSEDECRRFYVDVLGMTEVAKPPALATRGGLWVRADRLEIHLGVEPDFRPARKAHPGILVGDLDALAERLCAHGVEVTWDDNFPGYRRFYAFDNAGNRLEFLMSLGNRGSIS